MNGFACLVCGCTDLRACWDEEAQDGCHWVTPNICSVCWYADDDPEEDLDDARH